MDLARQFGNGLRLNWQFQWGHPINALQVSACGFGVLTYPVRQLGGSLKGAIWHDVCEGSLVMATKIQWRRD